MSTSASVPLETLTLAWHDATCPEGVDCRSRLLHGAVASTPGPIVLALIEVAHVVEQWHLKDRR